VDLTEPTVRAALTAHLDRPYAGRPVLVFAGVLAAATATVARIRAAGAARVLVIATAPGAGPAPEGCDVLMVDAGRHATVSEELRAWDRLLRTLPTGARRTLEAFDPDREGVWSVGPFVSSDTPLHGRPVRGGRPDAQRALEDKLRAQDVWDGAGIGTAPSRVVPVRAEALAAACDALAGPLGTVWTGDNREGFHGGGNLVRWVGDDATERADSTAFFARHCDRVRVMPFLDGVPCSIHGMVLPAGTAVLRPVEIAMLRDPRRRRFGYGGLGATWTPSPADTRDLRATARRVGDHLAARHGYRGAFGIDGVLTADGFRPTELNARFTAGLSLLAEVDPDLFASLQEALLVGEDPGIVPSDLERLLPEIDRTVTGRVSTFAEGVSVGGERRVWLAWDGTAFTRSVDATGDRLHLADIPSGVFARVEPCSALRPGARLAPVSAALARYLDAEHGTSFGRLEPAPDVRAAARG
jgi:hypothetical protein